MHFAGLSSRAASLLGAGALLMTMFTAPAFAQAQPPAEKKSSNAAQQKYLEDLLDSALLWAEEFRPGDDKKADPSVQRKKAAEALSKLGKFVNEQPAQPSPELTKLRDELQSLEIELKKRMAESEQLRAKMEGLRAHMKSVEAAAKDEMKGRVVLRLDDGKGGGDEIILRKVDGVWKVVPHDGKEGPNVIFSKPVGPGGGSGSGAPPKPPTPPPTVAPTPPSPGSPAPPPAAGQRPGNEAESRIDNLEKKLDKMMQLLDQMRKEMDTPRKKSAPEEEARIREIERASLQARDAAEAVERKVLQDRVKAAQEELKRVEDLRRKLEDAKRKSESKPDERQ
jgi:hypothetical protein